jgi:hypothetical protein
MSPPGLPLLALSLTAALTLGPVPARGVPDASQGDAPPATVPASLSVTGSPAGDDALARLSAAAPGLDLAALALGLRAHAAATRAGRARRPVLAVIDYALPSSARRLWVLDLERAALLFHERVAHGRGSGVAAPTVFSNAAGSNASSLGVFVTAEPYVGRHGGSLRLDGLEPGVNDAARARAIVLHGADYVTDAFVAEHGRAGRSHGCPAVDPAIAPRLIEAIAGGAVLLAYYPDPSWLSASPFVEGPIPRS